MLKQYLVTFNGRTLEGFKPEAVASTIGRAMGKPESYSEKLLSGTPVVLKRTSDFQAANDVAARLSVIGAETHIVELLDANEKLAAGEQLSQALPVAENLPAGNPVNEHAESAASRIEFTAVDTNAPTHKRSWRNAMQYRFDSSWLAESALRSKHCCLFLR